MALSGTLNDTSRVADQVIRETDLGATAISDVVGGATTLYTIDIDNGGSNTVYVKLYDALTATEANDPVYIFEVAATARRVISIPDGLAFSTGLSARCVEEAGTGGTTTPTGGDCAVTFTCS